MNRKILKIGVFVLIVAVTAWFKFVKTQVSHPAQAAQKFAYLLQTNELIVPSLVHPIALGKLASPAQNGALKNLGTAWNLSNAEPSTARFSKWWNKYENAPAQEKIALEKEGQILADERLVALKNLIQTDPERALENAIPFSVRRALPDSIAKLIEERVSGRGELAVFGVLAEPGKESKVAPIFRTATIDGREFKAFAYGRRLGEPTLRDVPLNGIAVDEFFAVNENPVRILEKAEAAEIPKTSETICSISGTVTTSQQEETAADVGGEIIFFCQLAHADVLNRQLIAEADVAASARTEGQKKLILIRVSFPDLTGIPFSDSTGTNLITDLNAFYTESSYGRTGFAPVGQGSDYTPTFQMSHNADYYGTNDYYNALRSEARAAATTAGYALGNYDLDLICMGPVPGFNWSGLGYVGAAGAWIRNSFSTGVSAHELGHNYGLNHANFWDTSGLSIIGTTGTNVEYGDIFDTMGSASAGNNHFNARNKRALNWIHTDEMATVTGSGTFRIYCHDNASSTGLRALSIAKNGNTNYWVEFRQKFTSNKWMMNGAGLRWAQTGTQQSLLLDTTPGSPDAKNDSALVIGRTFSDRQAGIYITPIGKGGTTPESLDVVVNKGTFPANVPPTLSILASATNVSAGATAQFTANATDANGDALAYYWDFGDGNFGTNGTTASKSWSLNKEYVVRCTATDMKGGVASDSVIVRVGSPTTYRISGQVRTNNTPIEGVRVYVSSAIVTYTDSDGTYNLVGLPAGTYTVNAQLDGYTFVHSAFSNPVSVGPNVTGIDFNTSLILPPVITSQPQSQFVGTGTNVIFTVVATGQISGYQWNLNGMVLANRTNSSLTLTNVQATDSGIYSVIVSNSANTVTSSNASLTVNLPPVIAAISDKTVTEGSLLTFQVAASDAANNTTNVFADFDNFPNGTTSVMFRAPNYSPTTAANLDSVPNLLVVTTNPPGGIENNLAALNVSWSFKNSVTNPWLRLTTFAASTLPNPTVNFSHRLRFSIYSDKALKVAAGLRETDSAADIGAEGGTTGPIEFVGVASLVNGAPVPNRSIAPNVWTTVELDLPKEPALSFSGGNGILESFTGKGVLEHLCFVPAAGSGVYNVYLDNFADVSSSHLTFSLDPGAPVGASIDPQSGVFSWVPDEMQSPGNYSMTIRVTDDGTPALSTTSHFSVNVIEANSVPILAAIPNQFLEAGATLIFTNSASDSDWPANVLSFSLGTNTLSTATLDSASGIFQWTAPDSEILLTNTVSIIVTDNGIPPQSDTQSFEIVVVPILRAAASLTSTDGALVLSFTTIPGKTYQIQFKNDLNETNWTNYGDPVHADSGHLSINDSPSQTQKFFRIVELN